MLRCFTVFTEDLYSLCAYKGVVFLCRLVISDGAHTVPLWVTRGCGDSHNLGCPTRGGEAWCWRRGLCRACSSVLEEKGLPGQFLGYIPAWVVCCLASSCLFTLSLLFLTFYLCFVAFGGGLG